MRGADQPPFLVGTFQSDKDVTIARWKAEKPFGDKTDRFIEAFSKALGKHRLEITPTHFRSESEGFVEEESYEIVARDAKTALIRCYSGVHKRYLESRIELTDDGYWTYSDDPVKGYCEKYQRIAK